MDIANRIILLCNERGISINRLSDLSCLTQSTVQNVVSGRNISPQIKTIEKICEGLNITLAEFFTEDKPELPPEALQEIKNFEHYIRNKYKK